MGNPTTFVIRMHSVISSYKTIETIGPNCRSVEVKQNVIRTSDGQFNKKFLWTTTNLKFTVLKFKKTEEDIVKFNNELNQENYFYSLNITKKFILIRSPGHS